MKICVVDDEREVRISIIHKLTALFPDEQVFNAEFGHEALERIEFIQPHLVFLDIRMPEMDGLELLQHLKNKYPDMYVVIISGYDDFEYARKAIQHGATDYLLKPADRGLMRDIVIKVKSNLEQAFMKELEYLLTITPIPYFSIQQIQPFNVSLWFDEREWKTIEIGDRSALLERYKDVPQDIMFTFFIDSEMEGIVVKASSEQMNSGFREKLIFLNVLKSEVEKRKAMKFFQTSDYRFAGLIQKNGTKEVVKYRQQIIHYARTGDFPGLESSLDAWFDGLAKLSYHDLRKECAHLMATLDEGLSRNDVIMLDEMTLYYWTDWVSMYQTWTDLKERVRKMVLSGVKALKNLEKPDRDGMVPQGNWFKQALQMMEESNNMNLNLDVVSEAVNVHPVTLSKMFKQQMGINFVRYLTRKRMQYASELLLGTNKKVNEISEDVGYADHAYFRGLFKKEFGYSPSEFRKQNGIITINDEAE